MPPQFLQLEDDVLSLSMFPKVAMDFFEKRRNTNVGINSDAVDTANKDHPV